jgi:hypothetical protein
MRQARIVRSPRGTETIRAPRRQAMSASMVVANSPRTSRAWKNPTSAEASFIMASLMP